MVDGRTDVRTDVRTKRRLYALPSKSIKIDIDADCLISANNPLGVSDCLKELCSFFMCVWGGGGGGEGGGCVCVGGGRGDVGFRF